MKTACNNHGKKLMVSDNILDYARATENRVDSIYGRL